MSTTRRLLRRSQATVRVTDLFVKTFKENHISNLFSPSPSSSCFRSSTKPFVRVDLRVCMAGSFEVNYEGVLFRGVLLRPFAFREVRSSTIYWSDCKNLLKNCSSSSSWRARVWSIMLWISLTASASCCTSPTTIGLACACSLACFSIVTTT